MNGHISWDVQKELDSYMRRRPDYEPIYPTCDECGKEMCENELVYVDGNDRYCRKCAVKLISDDLDVENLKYAYELTDYDND